MVRCGDWSVAWAGEAAGHQTADWRLAHLSTPGRHQAPAPALALDSSSMDTVDTGDTVDTRRPGQVARCRQRGQRVRVRRGSCSSPPPRGSVCSVSLSV